MTQTLFAGVIGVMYQNIRSLVINNNKQFSVFLNKNKIYKQICFWILKVFLNWCPYRLNLWSGKSSALNLEILVAVLPITDAPWRVAPRATDIHVFRSGHILDLTQKYSQSCLWTWNILSNTFKMTSEHKHNRVNCSSWLT